MFIADTPPSYEQVYHIPKQDLNLASQKAIEEDAQYQEYTGSSFSELCRKANVWYPAIEDLIKQHESYITENSYGPQAKTDENGNIIIIWANNNYVPSRYASIIISKYDSRTQTWSTPTELARRPHTNTLSGDIKLEIDQHGNAIALWNAYDWKTGYSWIQSAFYNVLTDSWDEF